MKAKICTLVLIYSINIPHKSVNFHKNLLVESQNYGQNYGQKNICQTYENTGFKALFVVK